MGPSSWRAKDGHFETHTTTPAGPWSSSETAIGWYTRTSPYGGSLTTTGTSSMGSLIGAGFRAVGTQGPVDTGLNQMVPVGKPYGRIHLIVITR